MVKLIDFLKPTGPADHRRKPSAVAAERAEKLKKTAQHRARRAAVDRRAALASAAARESLRPDVVYRVLIEFAGLRAVDEGALRAVLSAACGEGQVLGVKVSRAQSDADERAARGVEARVALASNEAMRKALRLDGRLEDDFGAKVSVSLLGKVVSKRRAAREEPEEARRREEEERRRLAVREDVAVAPGRTVRVAGVPPSMGTDAAVRQVFGAHGAVSAVVLKRDVTGIFKEVAWVEYADEQTALRVVEAMNGAIVGGRTLRVEMMKPQARMIKPPSF
eukprot:m51a1_g4088 hypothetical protein (279) ;mRNA; r:41416-42252